jgi:hypothetical protein
VKVKDKDGDCEDVGRAEVGIMVAIWIPFESNASWVRTLLYSLKKRHPVCMFIWAIWSIVLDSTPRLYCSFSP